MRVRGLLLDVEGVLVADKRYQAVPTAVEFITQARAAGCPLRLITNNTTDDRPTILAKLRSAGFDFALDELYTCTAAAARRLGECAVRRCLVLGNDSLRRIFADAGFAVVDAADVDAVIIGLDTGLTYARLQQACEALVRHGARLLALHHNRLYLDDQGRPAPSVGALAASIEYATRVEAEVIGKPSPAYFQQVLDDLGLPPQDVLVVSDDPLTDLAGAKRLGISAAFVLSGKYPNEHILLQIAEAERPDLTVPRIGDLLRTGQVTFAP